MKHTVLSSIVLLALAQQVPSQDGKVLFHVTSVEQGDATDYCIPDKCSATRLTVEGYTQDKSVVVQYVLECVEVLSYAPTPHVSVQCVRVHSHNDYMVKIGADFIMFGDVPSEQRSEPYLSGYLIKSEKEVRKK